MLHDPPDAMYVVVPEAGPGICRSMAALARRTAQETAPKLSGKSAKRIRSVYGAGFYGLLWEDPALWYQERGFGPFVMRSLHGVIPMWVDADPAYIAKHPKTKTRYFAASGRNQMLIFRFASAKGQRKMVQRGGKMASVPRSFPGAPGRINQRRTATTNTDQPFSRAGNPTKMGQIAQTNVGVRWRHPGLDPKKFLINSMMNAAAQHLLTPKEVRLSFPDGHDEILPKAEWT